MKPIHATNIDKIQLQDFWATIEKAVEDHGTPLFVYNPHNAEHAYRILKKGLRCWGEGKVAFSVKTNPFFALLQNLRRLGAYAEVVSRWEYELALNAGFPSEKIIFNGPLKSPEDLRFAAEHRPFTINIDSIEELDYLDKIAQEIKDTIRVGIRICPPRSQEFWSRFGLQFNTGEVGDAITRIQNNKFLELTTIHFHLGTQVKDSEYYVKTLLQVRNLWERFKIDSSHVWLDIGGGFPYQHDRSLNMQDFQLAAFFKNLRNSWEQADIPQILIEPGRFIAAPAFILICKVLACKKREGEPTIVVLDSGTNHNVMAAFFEHQWEFQHVSQSLEQFRLCGPLCMEDDIMSGALNSRLPQKGTLVAMLNAGAYSLSLSRTFIQPRPAIIKLKSNKKYELLVPRETIKTAYGLFPQSKVKSLKSGDKREKSK